MLHISQVTRIVMYLTFATRLSRVSDGEQPARVRQPRVPRVTLSGVPRNRPFRCVLKYIQTLKTGF